VVLCTLVQMHPRAHSRLDAVNLKVTVAGPDIVPALRAFGPRSAGVERSEISFCERPPHFLVDSGVILRLRVRHDGPVDTTVILRPCRIARVSQRWLRRGASGTYRFAVEGDWSEGGRVVAASLTRRLPPAGGEPSTTGSGAGWLWSDLQRRFVDDCADVAVDFDTLETYGPISVRRWPVVVDGLVIDVQRWTVSRLDLLELSATVDPVDADLVAPVLGALIRRQGLDPGAFAGTKTRAVLQLLAGR
jgi:hypothetical protein